jgi:hypothetical protein
VAQRALARAPAVSIALGRLLSSEEEQVANDTAETLAALQQGGARQSGWCGRRSGA